MKASSTPVLPVALFMDSVAHSHTDSVLGEWAINMISQKRHVAALIRKRQMCKCGCQVMVFPVPSDDPASLVPEGHGGWQVCLERRRWRRVSTCLANFVRKPVLRNQCFKLYLTHQFEIAQPRYPVAATMFPTGGATTSSVRRRVAKAWA